MLFSISISLQTALALTDPFDNSNSIDVSALTPPPVNCDQFCAQFAGTDSLAAGLAGGRWTDTDDQWCSNHGSPTRAGVMPDTSLVLAPSPGCRVRVFVGEVCSDVSRKISHCKMHNSQLEGQCLAYV